MTLRRGATLAILCLAVAAAMGLSLRNGFVYDDLPAIVHNARVTDPARWHTIFGSPYWLGTLWRPLTVALYAAEWFAGRGAPWVFHLTSLAGYLAVAVLLQRLLVKLGASAAVAVAVTVLFAVHPVHVEVVANAVGQAELWVAIAAMLSVALYLSARESGRERHALPWLLALVAAGIMAKEQGFIVPLLLAGAEWSVMAHRGERLAARVRLLVPVVALAALLFVIRGRILGGSVGETPAVALRPLAFGGRLTTFLAVVPEWGRLFVWPWHLQAEYGPPGVPVGGSMMLRHWFGALLVVAFIGAFWWSRRRAPVVAFGLLWIAVALAPVSNLVAPTGIVLAERVLFLPTIGLAIAACGVWMTATNSAVRRAPAGGTVDREARGSGRAEVRLPTSHAAWRSTLVALALYTFALTLRSADRVGTWRTQAAFIAALTRDGAQDFRSWKVAAQYWIGERNDSLAAADLRQAIALWPHDAESFESLGQVYRRAGRCDEAIPVFTAGVGVDPTATTVRAKLIECLIAIRDWNTAARLADDGVALGEQEFVSMQERVRRLRQ